MRHAFEDEQVGRYPGLPQFQMHADSIAQEEIGGAPLSVKSEESRLCRRIWVKAVGL